MQTARDLALARSEKLPKLPRHSSTFFLHCSSTFSLFYLYHLQLPFSNTYDMGNLSDLPNEILLIIARLLAASSLEHLYNFSQCGKCFHRVSTPLLQNIYLYGLESVIGFSRLVLHVPGLANYASSLFIEQCGDELSDSETDHTLPRLSSSSNRIQQFCDYVKISNVELSLYNEDESLWLAFLVLQLPRLRELKVHLEEESTYVEKLFEFAVKHNLFSNLSMIEVDFPDEMDVLPFLRLPALESFHMRDSHLGYYRKPQLTHGVRVLDLTETYCERKDLVYLLQALTSLEQLRISRYTVYDAGGEEYSIFKALAKGAANSLLNLDFFSKNPWHTQHRMEFTALPTLARVSIPSTIIFPLPVNDAGPRPETRLFPNSLVEMNLYLMSQPTVQQFWQVLRAFLEQKTLAPSLKTVSILHQTGQFDRQQDRQILEAIQEAADRRGITFRLVTFHGNLLHRAQSYPLGTCEATAPFDAVCE